MKKTNKKIGIALVVMSLISVVANYFNVLTIPMVVLSLALSSFVGFIAMMQVYHYHSYQDYNSGRWWLGFSAIGGVILVCVIYATGFNFLSNRLAQSLVMGLFPILVPVIGVFLGNMGRVLIKAEPSAI